ncbi:tRNA(Ile)-lysidine synthetase [Gracilibacillus boraciitolerans JCM 21714]|uniref:tRNA(Ile)-lysidine synthase n=1 Tax=Gracilibacillus boraciitolerans JCM 21714 TaxID=1298598 RepID=W4VLY1_9BACI|nr:tRNA lysidine(34) synthetase TilS [Gracilibacillus boraciitolerans]GAE94212.1 tRNA(Ile)-lysidine synthetase [Gracilibacillus boraciitolerans JCM 21714]
MKKTILDDKVLPFIQKHQLLHNGATVLVGGVSGGADSLLLLRYLLSIQQSWQLKIMVVSIDHSLRGAESASDVKYVESVCQEWNVPFTSKKVDVNQRKAALKEGTQVAARSLRYQAFEETMNEVKADLLALAHHGDDQIETILMRIVRQSNPSLLKGIPVKRKMSNGYIIRPFLCLTKDEIYHFCQDYQIIPREDPSNQSTVYTRNYFRLKILPLLKEQDHHVHQHVQMLTERVAEDQVYLETKAYEMVKETVNFTGEVAFFDINGFVTYPITLQRRAFHLILNCLYHEFSQDITYQHEADFFSLLRQEKSNVSLDFPGSLKVTKNYDEVRFYFPVPVKEEWKNHQLLKIPSIITLTDGSKLTINYTLENTDEDHHTLHIPAECESLLPLSIRVRQPGDRMYVKGLKGGHKKVKDIFIDEKIPAYKRDSWPLVFGADGTLLWLVGLKKAEIKGKSAIGKYIILTSTDRKE